MVPQTMSTTPCPHCPRCPTRRRSSSSSPRWSRSPRSTSAHARPPWTSGATRTGSSGPRLSACQSASPSPPCPPTAAPPTSSGMRARRGSGLAGQGWRTRLASLTPSPSTSWTARRQPTPPSSTTTSWSLRRRRPLPSLRSRPGPSSQVPMFRLPPEVWKLAAPWMSCAGRPCPREWSPTMSQRRPTNRGAPSARRSSTGLCTRRIRLPSVPRSRRARGRARSLRRCLCGLLTAMSTSGASSRGSTSSPSASRASTRRLGTGPSAGTRGSRIW
mmetsp:Transcript_60305/g.148323  ORF Transcript_60305/g.148323 Transcript_60305/m.148323 type:complete len:273 (+) Transcript_60305:3281-4099(+)